MRGFWGVLTVSTERFSSHVASAETSGSGLRFQSLPPPPPPGQLLHISFRLIYSGSLRFSLTLFLGGHHCHEPFELDSFDILA